MGPKKRKVDTENRRFLTECTEQYCFTLLDRPQAVPVCLISIPQKFPLSSEARKEKLQNISSYEKSTKFLVCCMSEKEKKMGRSSVTCCWTLSKHQKPFSDSEIMKECMLEVASALFEEKKDVVAAIQCQQEEIQEERTTRGEDLFKAIDEFTNNSDIRYDKIVSLSTDSALAMTGKEKGLVKKIRDQNPGLISYQCIIHQTALCGKLSATLKEVMDSLVQLINFISHSSLQHLKFKKFLSEWSKEALRIHNKRARYDIYGFSEGYSEIFKFANIELQRSGKLIYDLIQSVSAFRRKLEILEKDIARHEFTHFPTIQMNFLPDLRDEFATRFQDSAEIGKLSQFLKFPYEVDASAEWTDVPAKLFSVSKSSLQVEIIDLQEDISLQMYKTVSTEEFWVKVGVPLIHRTLKNWLKSVDVISHIEYVTILTENYLFYPFLDTNLT
ncbi:uncharacterized protein LOC124765444 [Schistocerca piceifrons]|uniref:uncharacterized protein LOC124765444 n=1 Tax=Schistocerca piceifrons TaxID=274613 RepID=UPI001F5FC50F|nr:uncharacterized protein LOC124765444 [Schistocerca piceifrons]